MLTPNTSPDFFESMFAVSADPWNFATDAYELERYAHILRALGPGPYRRALEPGCSVGELTWRLAALCERVDAYDIAPTAVATTQRRCTLLPGVTVRQASLNRTATFSPYDLVVLSEVGYYFTWEEWRALMRRVVDEVLPGTVVLASHWLGCSPDHVLSGDQVHDSIADTRLQHESAERHVHPQRGGFRLDRWRKL